MVNRIQQWIFRRAARVLFPCWMGILFSLFLLPATTTAAPRKIPVPRAHISGVERSFVNQGVTPVSGAGLRFFQSPDADTSGTERFDIRWFANPPGLPPGAMVMLESLQDRSASIKNHILRIHQKSEGNILSTIEIPSQDIRKAGRTQQWRVRIIWRGRSLATQTSTNWES